MSDKNISSVMKSAYENDKDFKEYVDKCALTYNKSVEEVFLMKITDEYRLSLASGGCNSKEKRGEGGKE